MTQADSTKATRPVSKIAELREQAGLTQLDISRSVGVTESTIANWEKGRSGIEWIEKLIKLCRILNCQLEDLIEYVSDNEEETPEFSQLREKYNKGKQNKKKIGSSSG
jgi:transcriptional regulator with XRE-family HTH domain